jgi:hypothetical protein
MHRPGALLELQLPVLDFEALGQFLLPLQFNEQLSGLVLGSHQCKGACHQNAGERCVQARHAPLLSATRITALRARGFAATSRSDGYTGLPTSFIRGAGRSAARTGNLAGSASGRDCARMNCFTIRSSREWKLMTTSRPPSLRTSTHWGSIISNSSSSLLM